MAYQVALGKSKGAGGRQGIPARQPHLYPPELFAGPEAAPETWWTCVRTRPRWEKKFAGWLRERGWTHFLPVFPHESVAGRKRRVADLPLFPGVVFVAGRLGKKDCTATGCVAYVLDPRGLAEARQLHRELAGIWRGLTEGAYVAPVRNLASGEICRITEGPLQGVEARFERAGRKGRLILQVEMMGGGIAVEVPEGGVEVT